MKMLNMICINPEEGGIWRFVILTMYFNCTFQVSVLGRQRKIQLGNRFCNVALRVNRLIKYLSPQFYITVVSCAMELLITNIN